VSWEHSVQPNEMQTLMLWALLARGGEAYAKEIKPEVKAKDRQTLVGLGLIGAAKGTRGAFMLSVTDKGWAWAAEHLDASLPGRSTAGCAILQAWLTRLRAYIGAKGVPLSEILAPALAEHADAPPERAGAPGGDAAALRERVRATYLAITGGSFNRRALLRDVRERLPDVDRHTLDTTLLRMQVDGDASLMQLDNRLEVTDADRAAAIQIGSEPRHILWIAR
jgi:hypothetical protein